MIKRFLHNLVNLLFPRLCASCSTKIQKGYLCPNCYSSIEFIKTYTTQNLISICRYKEPIKTLIYQFKYGNRDYLTEVFSELIKKHLNRIRPNLSSYDYVIPVPLHKYKLKERGYNQAELLAKILANYFQIPLRNDIIFQTKYIPSQTTLDKSKRLENKKGSFIAKGSLENRRIILVDDVITTGSTINECTKALESIKAAEIIAITLAKT